MKMGDIVKLRGANHFPRCLVVVPPDHPPWSDEWDVVTTLASWEIAFVTETTLGPQGQFCVNLLTSRGCGWIEGTELAKI